MKNKVITVSGREIDVKNCKKIANLYYEKGDVKVKDSGDCYLIKKDDGSETYVRKTNPRLIWDYELKEYKLLTNQISGIVEVKKNGDIVNGFFTKNIFENTRFRGQVCINADILKEAGYYYNPFIYDWEPRPVREDLYKLGMAEGIRKINYPNFGGEVYNANEHGLFGALTEYSREWQKKNFKVHQFDRLFNNQTFGVEIETSAGNMHESSLYKYGIMPLKDGSIYGHEYTSTIIEKFYFDWFKNVFSEASNCCTVNSNTSLHFHIGNIKKSKAFAVAFYQLYFRLQDAIETLCPPYKRDLHYLSNKRVSAGGRGIKDHCKRLPVLFPEGKITNVDKAFDLLLTFLNEGSLPEYKSERKLLFRHRKEGRPKWEYESRYYAVNLIPFLFEDKQTIEFRYHSGTVNFHKTFAWALICSALLQYAELNVEKILEGKEKIRLSDIISVYNDETREGIFITEWLHEYINVRTQNYHELMLRHDIFGKEFEFDRTFEVSIRDKKSPLNFF